MDLVVHPCFDPGTFTWSYVLANPPSGCCAIIDPVLDYDAGTGLIGTAAADHILALVAANGYCAEWILETHVHADHLSAARYLQQHLVCAQLAIGEHVRDVQAHFAPRLELDIPTDGRQFDRLLVDGERLTIGHASGRVMHTPGHTPACVTYLFEGLAFVGDTLFMPDAGTARCDFPGGDAAALYRSIQALYELPAETRMLLCHDYGIDGGAGAAPAVFRRFRFCTTVADQRRGNRMLDADTTLDEFVAARRARDRELDPPRLLAPALRANIQGGVLPVEDVTGRLDTPILEA